MSDQLRDKWNQRYAEADPTNVAIARILRDFLYLLPKQGHALDLACGLGSNSLFLGRHGFVVDAWDISEVAISRLSEAAQRESLPITALSCDVTRHPLPQQQYDLILITRFLERGLAPAIVSALKPGGLLFYQTWTVDRLDSSGPGNPSFLLQPNELLQLFAPLRIVAYREDGRIGDLSKGIRNEAMLVAQGAF